MMKQQKEKKLRVKFCLACKSFNVRYVHGLKNIFGIIPRMKCNDCGLETEQFPILEITQKELEKKQKADKKTKKITKQQKVSKK